jgi:hypothetical protein
MKKEPEEKAKVKKTKKPPKKKTVPQKRQKTTFSPNNPFVEAFKTR